MIISIIVEKIKSLISLFIKKILCKKELYLKKKIGQQLRNFKNIERQSFYDILSIF